jgi:hypothetical protein
VLKRGCIGAHESEALHEHRVFEIGGSVALAAPAAVKIACQSTTWNSQHASRR